MSAEQTLYDTLKVAAPVAAVVGARIYLDVIPQSASLPAVAFVRSGTQYENTIHGAVARTRATVEVWAVAKTRTAAESLATLAMNALLPANFSPTDRRPETDPESPEPTFSAVLTYSIWE